MGGGGGKFWLSERYLAGSPFFLVARPICVSRKKCLGITSVINICEGVPSRITHFITKVNNFGPFFGPSSDCKNYL